MPSYSLNAMQKFLLIEGITHMDDADVVDMDVGHFLVSLDFLWNSRLSS